jgi:hypothetical protein
MKVNPLKKMVNGDITVLAMSLLTALFMGFCSQDILIPLFSSLSLVCLAVLAITMIRLMYVMAYNAITLICLGSILSYAVPMSYYFLVQKDAVLVLDNLTTYGLTAIIVFACAVGYVIGMSLPRRYLDLEYVAKHSNSILLLSCAFSVLQLYLIVSGQWVYGVNLMGDQVERSPFVIFLGDIAHGIFPAVGLLAGSIYRTKRFSPALLTALAIIIAVQLGWNFIGSRRDLVIEVGLFGIFFIIAWKNGQSLTRKELLGLAFGAAAAIFMFNIGGKLYYIVRVSSQGNYNRALSLSDMVGAFSTTDTRVADEAYSSNLISRPFIINSVGVFESTHSGVLMGRLLIDQYQVGIPRLIWPGKEPMKMIPEYLWNQYEGVPFNDWANSIWLGSYSDYGYIGFPIYLLIIFLMQAIVSGLARRFQMPAIYLILNCALIASFLQTEIDFSGFTVWLRDSLVLIALTAVVTWASSRLYRLPATARLQGPVSLPGSDKLIRLSTRRISGSSKPGPTPEATQGE